MSLLVYLLGTIGVVGLAIGVLGLFVGFLGAPILFLLRKTDDDAIAFVTYARIAAFYGLVVGVLASVLLRGLTE